MLKRIFHKVIQSPNDRKLSFEIKIVGKLKLTKVRVSFFGKPFEIWVNGLGAFLTIYIAFLEPNK